MARSQMFYEDGFSIKVNSLFGFESYCRTSTDGPRLKRIVPIFNTSGCRKTLEYVLVCDYRRTLVVHPLVAVGVVPMPVRIDDVLDRFCANSIERSQNLVL